MKTPQRITKAAAVIIIVGIGLFYNQYKRMPVSGFIKSSSIYFNDYSIKSDSLNSDESKKLNESRLFIYTKNIINEGIHHLISNL